MSSPGHLIDHLRLQLSSATATVAEMMAHGGGDAVADLAGLARLLERAERHLTWPSSTAGIAPAAAEGDDERSARVAAESAARVRVFLASLRLTERETQFALSAGERLVDELTVAYQAAGRNGPLSPSVITAAAAIALMIVHDPPE